jgi:beta-mannosidase
MQKLSLNGAWKLERVKTGKIVPATVPGWTHSDLLRSGDLEDLFWRDNAKRALWVSGEDWRYFRDFEVSESLLKRPRLLLRCHGLDTLCRLSVNGKKLADTDNMYRVWEFDLRPFLRPGRNRIEALFKSVIPVINRAYKKHPLYQWEEADPARIPHYAYVRKAPYQFGWDWSPAIVGYGIWKEMEISGFSARFSDLRVVQHLSEKTCRLEITGAVDTTGTGHTVACRLRGAGKAVAQATAAVKNGRFRMELKLQQPRLWWPNGMGEAFLYELESSLVNQSGAVEDHDTKKIGLRNVELVREKDAWGHSFYFKVNGKPLWARGANWVPADSLAHKIAGSRTRKLVEEMAAQHMNILRVWGGGFYESDDFYDACDALGVLVWQDFMFACSTYPGYDKKYLANVKVEAEDNVRRLRHHASLCLWCGNNELEEGLVGSNPKRQMPVKDYNRLFCGLLPEVVRRLNPETPYTRSSGCSPGPRRDQEASRDPDHGDAHLWWLMNNVYQTARNIDANKLLNPNPDKAMEKRWDVVWGVVNGLDAYGQRQVIPRFASEYGKQSFPVMKTVRSFSLPSDQNPLHPVMEYHQRGSNGWMLENLLAKFMPSARFEGTVLLTQITQGENFRWLVESWRRSRPRCMGALHWTGNDCWPSVEWSTVDYYLRRKASFYIFRRFYSPLLISGEEDPKKLTCGLVVTNDGIADIPGRLDWRLTNLQGKKLLGGSFKFVAKACASSKAKKLNLKKEIEAAGRENVVLWMEWHGKDGSESSNAVFFAEPRKMPLAKADLKATVSRRRDGSFAVTLRTDKPALWAWVNVDDGETHWSDNYFHLSPGVAKRLVASTPGPMTLSQFRSRLKAGSLVDLYP